MAIEREIPDVTIISPEYRSSAQVASGNENWSTTIQGESQDYLDIRQWPLVEGSMFTAADVRAAGKVCVVGKTVADQDRSSTLPAPISDLQAPEHPDKRTLSAPVGE